MQKHSWRAVAGVLIILVGIILLLWQMGVITLVGVVWPALGLIAGALAFGALWLSNTQEWWPLIPAGVMGGWGVATLLGTFAIAQWAASLVGFVCSALPFFYIFFRLGTQEGWWAIIPGGVIAAWGVGTVLGGLGLPSVVVPLAGFVGSALPFLFIFVMDRTKNWWALIPGGILAFMGVVTTLGTLVGEEWTATFVLWGIALLFAVIFVTNRQNQWALVPAGVLAVVGFGISPVASTVWVVLPVALIVFGALVIVRTLWRRT